MTKKEAVKAENQLTTNYSQLKLLAQDVFKSSGDNLSPVDYKLKSTTNAAFNTLQIVTGSETVIAKYHFRGATKMVDISGGSA